MITNLTADERIQPGEPVVTSGGDQVFPRGLPVGTVESIAPDPEHQPYTAIRVKPAANLFQLDEVLVVTGTAPQLPPGAMAELRTDAAVTAAARAAAAKAAAEAAAAKAEAERQKEEEARTAAEIVADRLPSLRGLMMRNRSPPLTRARMPPPRSPAASCRGRCRRCTRIDTRPGRRRPQLI